MSSPTSSRVASPHASWHRFFRLRTALPVLLLGVVLFYLFTLRAGLAGGGDAAQYILHAKNLAEGQPYAETGYIQNPYLFVAPKSYPPGFPLLLAPVIALFGVSLTAMKVEMVLLFAAALVVIACAFRRVLSPAALCALVAVLGLHPYFWDFKDSILSDIPFLLLVFASLLAYDEAHREGRRGRARLLWALGAAAGAGLAIATRSLGVVLLPTFLAYDLIRARRPGQPRLSRPLLVVGGVFAALGAAALVYAVATGAGGGSYLRLVQDQLSQPGILLRRIGVQSRQIIHILSTLWDTGYGDVLSDVGFALSAPLVLAGFWTRLRRQRSVFEVFSVLYVLALLPWSFLRMRYLIPLFPLYFLYLFVGAGQLAAWTRRATGASRAVGPQAGRALLAVGLLAVAGVFGAKYSTLDYGPIVTNTTTPAAEQFFAYVRQHTAPEDVLVSEVSRQTLFFAERSTAALHDVPLQDEEDEEALLRYFREISADYVVVGPPQPVPAWENDRILVERLPERFERVYGNDEFQLYRIRYEEAAPEDAGARAPAAVPSALSSFSWKKPAALATCASSSSAAWGRPARPGRCASG